jgi:hypothetical protein
MKKLEPKISIKFRVFCPLCGELSNSNSKILLRQLEYLFSNKLPWYAFNDWIDEALNLKGVKNSELGSFLIGAKSQPDLIKLFKQDHFEWACDNCIEINRAIEGQIEEQTFCDNPPFLAYVDKDKKCQTCGSDFIFSKEEQKYWYEELKFWVQSTPKNCTMCRKIIRDESRLKTKLSNLIKTLDEQSSEQLIEVSQLYFEIGRIEKGKHYATLANK